MTQFSIVCLFLCIVLHQQKLSDGFWLKAPSRGRIPYLVHTMNNAFRNRVEVSPGEPIDKRHMRLELSVSEPLSAFSAMVNPQSAENGNDNYEPAIELASGAARAFAKIDRNLVLATAELAKMNELLRKMASQQSEFLSRYLEQPETPTTAAAKKAVEQSVVSVKELVSMDRRLSRSLSGLYEISSSLKRMEAENNDFISRLAGNAVASPNEIQERVTSTSRAFDEIEHKLFSTLTEVRELGLAFKTLDAKSTNELAAFSNDNSVTDSSNDFQTKSESSTFSPPSAVSEPVALRMDAYPMNSVPPASQSPVENFAPFSLLPVPPQSTVAFDGNIGLGSMYDQSQEAIPTLPKTEPVQAKPSLHDTKFESALQLSIAAADAFNNMGTAMDYNDKWILDVLYDLKASLCILISHASNEYGEELFAGNQRAIQSPTDSHTFPSVSSSTLPRHTAKVSAETLNPPSAASDEPHPEKKEQSYRKRGRELSEAAAKAFEKMTNNMARNDQEAFDLLQELSRSFQTLASSEYFFLDQVLEQKSGNPVNDPTVNSDTHAPHSVEETFSTPVTTMSYAPTSSQTVTQTSMKPDQGYQIRENALQLSEAAANAFNDISHSMSSNDEMILRQLKELRTSFQRLASSESGLAFPNQQHSSVSNSKTRIEPSSSYIDQHADYNTEGIKRVPSGTEVDQVEAAHERAMRLSSEAVRALYELDKDMTRSDAKAIAILEEINVSFKRLADKDYKMADAAQDFNLQQASQVQTPGPPFKSENSFVKSSTSPFQAYNFRATNPHDNIVNQEALHLSAEAARAFKQLDSTMGRNDNEANRLLHEISRSFAKLAKLEAGLSSFFWRESHVAQGVVTPVDETKHDIANTLTWKTEEDEQPTVDISISEQTEDSRERARKLSTEAAQAFYEVDANMNINDEETLMLLNEIKSSFQKLSALDGGLSAWSASVQSPTGSAKTAPSASSYAEITTSRSRRLGAMPIGLSDPAPSSTITSPHAIQMESEPSFSVPSEIRNEVELKRARELSRQAAQAFSHLDTNAATNDAIMLSLLKDIDDSFARLAEIDEGHFSLFSSKSRSENDERHKPESNNLVSKDPLERSASVPLQAVTSTHSDDTTRERAKQLSVEAARAFGEVDASMVNNSNEAIALFREINKSFRHLASLDEGMTSLIMRPDSGALEMTSTTAQASKAAQDNPNEPIINDEMFLVPPLESSSQIVDDGSSPSATHPSLSQSIGERDLKRARDLSFEAARAFSDMDIRMVSNDKATLSVLNEINDAFAKLAAAEDSLFSLEQPKPDYLNPAPRQDIFTSKEPSEVETGHQRSYRILDVEEQFESTSPDALQLGKDEAIRNRAVQLSIEAAHAFIGVDALMVNHDERTIALLNEINDSFGKLASLDDGLCSLYGPAGGFTLFNPPTVVEVAAAPHRQGGDLDFVLLDKSARESLPSPATSPSTAQTFQDFAREVELNRAKELSLEAARAMKSMDASMISNDQAMILLLKEIDESFSKLAAVENGLSSLFRSSSKSAEHHSAGGSQDQRVSVSDSFDVISKDSPGDVAVIEKKEGDKWIRHRAIQLSVEAARAMGAVDAIMTKSDAKSMAVLEEINQSFKRLAALDNGLSSLYKPVSSPAPSSQPNAISYGTESATTTSYETNPASHSPAFESADSAIKEYTNEKPVAFDGMSCTDFKLHHLQAASSKPGSAATNENAQTNNAPDKSAASSTPSYLESIQSKTTGYSSQRSYLDSLQRGGSRGRGPKSYLDSLPGSRISFVPRAEESSPPDAKTVLSTQHLAPDTTQKVLAIRKTLLPDVSLLFPKIENSIRTEKHLRYETNEKRQPPKRTKSNHPDPIEPLHKPRREHPWPQSQTNWRDAR